ncbi:hypothetical protein DUNSADRAFT_5795 [Dunaliella salina]|uniref:Uncharacterized protein n=1 Tax=Dunaliella salina TaxID=3046 RepID=A0ABQ7GPP2_DUNSA|nr:hypothetical protein DUNSADRAFT_5795 [Dunaliella salina]|eukprot:KAF5836558.1 hypothetical protein DUNSADRAFT_5795 [Dunaliella salina]
MQGGCMFGMQEMCVHMGCKKCVCLACKEYAACWSASCMDGTLPSCSPPMNKHLVQLDCSLSHIIFPAPNKWQQVVLQISHWVAFCHCLAFSWWRGYTRCLGLS